MEVVLVGPEAEENLSLRYLAAALVEAGHAWRIVPFTRRAEVGPVARAIMRSDPGLVGLSMVHQKRVDDFYALVRLLRARGYAGHVTAGGHFASLRAREVLRDAPGIDTILHHEGERRLAALARRLEAGAPLPGDVDGITWRNGSSNLRHEPARHLSDLDDLPRPVRRMPNRELGIPTAPIVSSRGCAGSCTFCSIHAWHRQVRGSRLRLRDPESVAQEMAALHREHGVRIFIFHDDDFIHPRRDKAEARCRAILDRAADLIGVPFSFVIKCRPDDVEEGLFAYLQSRGLDRAYVGIESHAPSGLRTLNRRVTQAQNLRALEVLDGLGIYSCFNLLIWDPDTTLDAFDENLAFLGTQVGRPFDIARTELYAGATLEQRMIREGRVIGDYRGWDYRILDPRAERIFRLFTRILWDRHFGPRPVTQGVQDLGYRMALLRRFHPETVSRHLADRFQRLVRDVNEETVGRLQAIRDFVVATNTSPHPRAVSRFACRERARVRRTVWLHRYRLAAVAGEVGAKARLARAGGLPIPGSRAGARLLERVAASVPVAGLSFLLSACGGGEHEVVCDPPPPPLTYTWQELGPLMEGACARTGCHNPSSAAAGLVLGDSRSPWHWPAAYDALVDVPSTQLPSMDRVEPGDPDASYLYRKMADTHLEAGGSGESMPPAGVPDSPNAAWVREWIARGARRSE